MKAKRELLFLQETFNMKAAIFFMIISLGLIGCNNLNNTKEIHITNTPAEKSDTLAHSDAPLIAQQIARANGFENWDEVAEINFTFNVERNGKHFSRSWSWNPRTDSVKMISETDSLFYNRKKMDSLTMKTDAAFINDKYWMLAPFQLIWDKGLDFSNEEKSAAPISKDTLGKLTIVYPNQGGYTPGDAYDFFYDENFLIREWNYRKGNAPEPSTTTTWEDYKDFDGIKIATMHKGAEGDFKLYFTDISVR